MTTKADTSVKWFHSEMLDAPALSGQAGKLIELLDTCLINGFSTRTPDSVVVADGVATVSISAGNPYEKHAVVAISGASNPALNAEWRIATSGASSFTFLCPGVSDGAVTGATIKRAGAGWVKPFSETNVGVYRSQKLSSTQMYLRVDDSNAQHARVRGYEQMSDANTGIDPFPLLTTLNESNFTWMKSYQANSTTRRWCVVADGHFMHVLLYPWSNGGNAFYQGATGLAFGDIASYVPGDAYHCMICAFESSSPATPAATALPLLTPSASNGRYFARESNQTSKAQAWIGRSAVAASSGSAPPAADGVMRYHPIYPSLLNSSASGIRGVYPGLFASQEQSTTLKDLQVSDVGGHPIMEVQVGSSIISNRQAAFDIVGPWR